MLLGPRTAQRRYRSTHGNAVLRVRWAAELCVIEQVK